MISLRDRILHIFFRHKNFWPKNGVLKIFFFFEKNSIHPENFNTWRTKFKNGTCKYDLEKKMQLLKFTQKTCEIIIYIFIYFNIFVFFCLKNKKKNFGRKKNDSFFNIYFTYLNVIFINLFPLHDCGTVVWKNTYFKIFTILVSLCRFFVCFYGI